MLCYFLDFDGSVILVTPRPLMPNYEGMQPVDLSTYPEEHPYSKVLEDARHFYRTAGDQAAALIYNIYGRHGEGPVVMGTLWLTGANALP